LISGQAVAMIHLKEPEKTMQGKPYSMTTAFRLVAIGLLSLGGAIVARTPDGDQDLNFRLTNIERRLDQMQMRVDFIERAQQNQAMQTNAASSNLTTQTVLELQRQHLSLAEQVVQMQKRMLDMQKTIDRLSEREAPPEKREPTKPKPAARP
jgi:hypothetical protein